ncbi:MAG: PepSY domain-containing protein [Zhengella sp.]|uniref:PepSY domain-containing protein n=1 Tax=Zhengella sp. TaxID=2282762 RepID=UPI001D230D90|nr:PepSY domain-containing protein [Notoacmeibacter sp.]MCC0025546.1 PepSY domain-containing protein [Brucellaceae bacterium]
MRILLTALALSATAAAVQPALASDNDKSCGNAPRNEWMSEDAVKAKASEMGYEVRSVKVEDGCFEVYAMNSKGERAEVYMNPVTGDVVRTKMDD